ncbi:MAG: DUF2793 domain-containing protein, partial [Nanoarchaeota archaeon]|nr:DUF2793 domain-containing protein [Nanoarchaeota archaeon]
MTGDLNVSANLKTTGNFTVGTDFVIWSNGTVEVIDSDTVYGGVADSWVNESGDTMTGNLTMNGNWINGFLTRLAWGNISSVPGFVTTGDTYVNASGDVMTGDLNVSANLKTTGNFTVGTDFVIWSNGTVEVIDSDTIYGGVADDWINETGDTMTGELNISNKIYLYPNGTILMDGNLSVPTTVVIWSNGTVETTDSDTIYGGATDSYVNTTGDYMTGELNISAHIYLYPNGTINVDGNYSVPTGVVIWSNGTVETGSSSSYSGVADDWLNETGDDLRGNITVNANKTYWLGNQTEWFGKIWTDIVRSVTATFDTVTINENLLVLGNITGNLSASNVTLKDAANFFPTLSENAERAFEYLGSAIASQLNGTWKLPILDKDLNAPPGTPSVGDRYIIAGQTSWYDQRWPYRVPIEIDSTYVYKNESNYAIRIAFPPGSPVFTNALANGTDIVFTKSDGQTKITTGELELYDSSIPAGVFWIKLDLLDSTANTTIYAYYGYSGASAQYDISSAQNTWKKNYGLVYHMNFTAVPPTGSYFSWDSTTNARHVGSGSTTYVGLPALASSIDGYGTYFDGTDDAFNLKNMPYYESNWGEGEYGNRTHIIVFNTSADITTRQFIASEGGTVNGWDCYIENSNITCGAWAISNGFSGKWFTIPIEANHDNYVVTTVFRCDDTDRNEICETSTNDQYNNFTMYLNGTLVGTAEHSDSLGTEVGMNAHSGDGGIGYTGKNDKLLLGGGKSSASTHFFGGTIREFQIIDIALDLNAHKTFETMFNDTSFMSISSEQSQSSGATGAWAGHENNITEYNSSGDWDMRSAQSGWTVFVKDESLIYAYDATVDAWIIASLIGSHRTLTDLNGCDPITNICWHFANQDDHDAATRYATNDQGGLMPAGYTTEIGLNTLYRITEWLTDEQFLNGTLEDGILNITLRHWLLVNATGDIMTGDLNVSANLKTTGNFTVGTDFVIWSNGTIETGATASYGGVADDWVNVTGDTMTGNLTMNGNWINGFLTRLAWGNISSVPGFITTGDTYVNASGDAMTGDLNITGGALLVNNGLNVSGDFFVNDTGGIQLILYKGCSLETVAGGNIVCGTDADTIYSGVADDWVNETGDYMTGEFNISGKIYLYPNGSINVDGNYSVPTGVVIWSNGTVEVVDSDTIYGGLTDTFVNTTGDNMTSLDANKTYWIGSDSVWWGKIL